MPRRALPNLASSVLSRALGRRPSGTGDVADGVRFWREWGPTMELHSSASRSGAARADPLFEAMQAYHSSIYIHSGHVHRIYVSNSHISTMCIKRAFEFCFSNFAMARFRQCCGDAGFFFVGLRYPVVIGEWQPRRPLASKVPVVDSA